MAKQVQFRGGSTAQNDAFIGASREITVDTENNILRVHDGETTGGQPLAKGNAEGTALDSVKLNGKTEEEIKNEAKLTPEEVLTRLKTVDGEGSGLDADTVDGVDKEDLLDRNNHTGKQPLTSITELTNEGSGDKYLADDGTYKEIIQNTEFIGLNDTPDILVPNKLVGVNKSGTALEFVDTLGFDYKAEGKPTHTVNPDSKYALWADTKSPEIWTCIDNTPDENIWRSTLGKIVMSPSYITKVVIEFHGTGYRYLALNRFWFYSNDSTNSPIVVDPSHNVQQNTLTRFENDKVILTAQNSYRNGRNYEVKNFFRTDVRDTAFGHYWLSSTKTQKVTITFKSPIRAGLHKFSFCPIIAGDRGINKPFEVKTYNKNNQVVSNIHVNIRNGIRTGQIQEVMVGGN